MGQDQSGCLDRILKFFAIVMAIGLIISLPLALAGRSFGRVIFKPSVLTGIVRENVIGSGALQDFLQEGTLGREIFGVLAEGDGDIGRYFAYLSAGERQEILLALLPPDWIENQFSGVIRSFFSWLDSDMPSPEIELDARPLKAKLLGGGITAFVDIVVDSWPSCTPEQGEALEQAFFEGGMLPRELCEPPEPMRSRVVDLASIGFEEQVRKLPESIPLGADAPVDEFVMLKDQLLFLRAISLWGWMLPLSLLGVIMALAIRKWRDFGRWWGVPLILGGLGTLFFAMILGAGRDRWITTWSSGMIPSGFLHEILATTLNALYGAGLRPLWLQGFLVLIFGSMLWFVSRRGKERVAPVAVEELEIQTKILDRSPEEDEDDEPGEPPEGIFG